MESIQYFRETTNASTLYTGVFCISGSYTAMVELVETKAARMTNMNVMQQVIGHDPYWKGWIHILCEYLVQSRVHSLFRLT